MSTDESLLLFSLIIIGRTRFYQEHRKIQVCLSGPEEGGRLVKIFDMCSSFVSAAVANTAQGKEVLI